MPTSTHASVEPLIIQFGTDHTLAPLAVRERMALSADAAAVLGLAESTVPLALSQADEAERWLRVLREHGYTVLRRPADYLGRDTARAAARVSCRSSASIAAASASASERAWAWGSTE